MSGKGKGKHAAKKEKYGRNPIKTPRNKAKRQDRRTKELMDIEVRAQECDQLLEKAMKILNLKKAGIKRIVGTLNRQRLRDVVENTYLNSKWYLDRESRKESKHVHTRVTKNSQVTQMSEVFARANSANGDSQVDPKRESSQGSR